MNKPSLTFDDPHVFFFICEWLLPHSHMLFNKKFHWSKIKLFFNLPQNMSVTTSPNSIKNAGHSLSFYCFSEALPKNNHFDQLVTLKCISIACMPSYRLYTRKNHKTWGTISNNAKRKDISLLNYIKKIRLQFEKD